MGFGCLFFFKQEMLFNDICLAHRGQRTRLLWARVTSSPLSWYSQGPSLSLLGCNHRILEREALVQRESDSGESFGPRKGAVCGIGRTVPGSAQPQSLGICHVNMSAVVPRMPRGGYLGLPSPCLWTRPWGLSSSLESELLWGGGKEGAQGV